MSKKIKLESKYCIGLDVPLILLNSDYYDHSIKEMKDKGLIK